MASDPACPAVCQNPRKIIKIMARHPEICCILFALVFCLLSKYSRSYSKQFANQPPPRRFFPASSPVLDFPYGNLGDVGNLLVDEEVLVVMYYAPWCGKSMRVKAEFERAAKYLQDEVLLVGINCWYPKGSCRQQNHFMGYPIIYFYHTTLDGFRYHGILRADHLIAFVKKMLYPIIHIATHRQLAHFVAHRDNAVVGFFDFHSSPQPPGYHQFYCAAMRTLENDPINPVEYGMMTDSSLAASFGMRRSKTIYMYRSLNDTLKFPTTWNVTSSALVKWLFTVKQKLLVTWMLPLGTKSLSLSSHVQKGPTLILFTPSLPLFPVNQYFSLLREVLLDYSNCKNQSKVWEYISSSRFIRWIAAFQHDKERERCLSVDGDLSHAAAGKAFKHKPLPTKKCCISMVRNTNQTSSHHNTCDVCVNYHSIHPQSALSCHFLPATHMPTWPLLLSSFSSPMSTSSSSSLWSSSLTSAPHTECTEVMSNYNPGEFLTVCCDMPQHTHTHTFKPGKVPSHSSADCDRNLSKDSQRPDSSKVVESIDPFVREKLSSGLADLCWHQRFQRKQRWLPATDLLSLALLEDSQYNADFTGLGCGLNRSLQVLVMDSRRSHMFAEGLGVDLGPQNNKTTLVLVDREEEAHSILTDEVTVPNIVQFLQNYTDRTLARHQRSTVIAAPDACSSSSSSSSSSIDSEEEDKNICILETNAENFQHIVMDESKDVLLLYYTPWCGFCAGFAHIYMSLARYFRSAKNVVFARVQGDGNDLPWELTVDSYPTVTLFPAHRKTESVSFPDHMEKSLPNLVKFVLRYSAQALKLETGLTICSRACLQSNLASAAATVHSLTAEVARHQQRASKVRDRVREYRDRVTALTTEEASGSSSLNEKTRAAKTKTYEERIVSLELYAAGLQRRLVRKQLQQRNARMLHKTLVATSGVHLEKHKLTAILQRYEVYKRSLDEKSPVAAGWMYTETGPADLGRDAHDSDSRLDIHDEL